MRMRAQLDGAEALSERLATMPARWREMLLAKSQTLAVQLRETIVQDKLSGDPLQSRTGRLAEALTATSLWEDEGLTIDLSVAAADVPYAAAQEYGFSGTESVSAGHRVIGQVFGRPITPKDVLTRTFSRMMHLPERSYLRAGFDENAQDIVEGLRAALMEAVQL